MRLKNCLLSVVMALVGIVSAVPTAKANTGPCDGLSNLDCCSFVDSYIQHSSTQEDLYRIDTTGCTAAQKACEAACYLAMLNDLDQIILDTSIDIIDFMGFGWSFSLDAMIAALK